MIKEASGIAVHCAHDDLADVVNLIPNPRNPNKHGDKQVAMLAKIIRHQGWRAPIVVSNRSGFVVAGHGRLEAARLLNVELVPVNRQDFATEADEWAHLIADNKIAELAETDYESISALISELDGKIDVDLFGMDSNSINVLTQADWSPSEGNESGDIQVNTSMKFTEDQYKIVSLAIQKLKSIAVNAELIDSQCVEKICRQYME